MRRIGSVAAFMALAVGSVWAQAPAPPLPETVEAFRAVGRAWSLPPEAAEAAALWPGAAPEELAAAVLLGRAAGLTPAQAWELRRTAGSWREAARQARVDVEGLVASYRGRVSEPSRARLAEDVEELVAAAEIRTLERLTGKAPETLARELSRAGFTALASKGLGPPARPGEASPAPPVATPAEGLIPSDARPKNDMQGPLLHPTSPK